MHDVEISQWVNTEYTRLLDWPLIYVLCIDPHWMFRKICFWNNNEVCSLLNGLSINLCSQEIHLKCLIRNFINWSPNSDESYETGLFTRILYVKAVFLVLISNFPYVFVCLCDWNAALNQVYRGLILQYTFLYFVIKMNACKFEINSRNSKNTYKFDYKCISTIVYYFFFALSLFLCHSSSGFVVLIIPRCLYFF